MIHEISLIAKVAGAASMALGTVAGPPVRASVVEKLRAARVK